MPWSKSGAAIDGHGRVSDPVRVLVIDDSVTIRAVMVRVLEADRGFTATAVRSADEAERVLATRRFDVATLDVDMPGRSGMDFVGLLVRVHKLPVIMLSGSTTAGSAACAAAIDAGADACFDKSDAVKAAPRLRLLLKRAAVKAAARAVTDASSAGRSVPG